MPDFQDIAWRCAVLHKVHVQTALQLEKGDWRSSSTNRKGELVSILPTAIYKLARRSKQIKGSGYEINGL